MPQDQLIIILFYSDEIFGILIIIIMRLNLILVINCTVFYISFLFMSDYGEE